MSIKYPYHYTYKGFGILITSPESRIILERAIDELEPAK
jgi:hypothetical protein